MHQGHPVPGPSIYEERLKFGTVDPHGKLWFGSMKQGKPAYGRLFSFSPFYWPYLKTHLHQQGVRPHVQNGNNLGNGVVWFPHNLDYNRLYFNDARKLRIEMYFCDIIHQDVEGAGHVVFNLNQHRGDHIPDHARIGRFTVDNRGWMWLPIIGGSGILEFNPYENEVGRFIEIPSSRGVSACVFGGHEMRTLYATTIGPLSHEIRAPGDDSGAVFSVGRLGEGVWGFLGSEFVLTTAGPSQPLHPPHGTH
ncbi:putative sugar lactone lactonase YvrE [Belonocnema kinseyi]|uniref:putative sugar lactone lactonase YvrE n=1 Tax=Belonocnema kinseyi TaxID=2817044 RepID=UPI00143D9A3A|nr:putative sugar lactone lactonase YvrE [Belonocnema kinseyi]